MEKAQAATQEADRTQREVEIAKADAEKRVIAAQAEADANMIRAKGEAEANKLLTESLTSQVLDLRRMEVEEARIAKWNGSVPTTVLGQGGGVFYTIDESSDK
jgi:regulator of protease activity HflC (stomatin/prohibitin superfamily)